MTTGIDDELALFESLKTKYSPLLANFREDNEHIDGHYGDKIIPAGWADEGLEVTVPPTVNDAVQNAADHLLTTPRIGVPARPVTEGKEAAQQLAEKKRAFYAMWWGQVFEQQGDPLGRGKTSLIKGKLVLKKEIRWDVLPKLPDDASASEKRRWKRQMEKAFRTHFPWTLRLIPKETLYEDLEQPWDPRYCYEAFKITSMEAKRRFPDNTKVALLVDPLTEHEFVEYWSKPEGSDPGRFIQWLGRDRVHEADNPYSWETSISTRDEPDYDGYIPYIIGDPGWGDVDERNRPEDRYKSIIRPMLSVAEAETRVLTEAEAFFRMGYVFPPLKGRNLPDVEDGEKQLELGPGVIWNFSGKADDPEGQDANFMQAPDLPISLFQFMQRVHQYADQSSKFGILGGVAQRGVDTATEADANTRNAATKLSGPVRALRRMVMRINTQIAQDIEKVLEAPVTIYGAMSGGPSEVTLAPREINGFYATSVELETSDEAALNLRNARTWGDLYRILPVSARTALEKAGIQNPTSEIDERTIENIEQSPQALQLMILMMLAGQGELGNVVRQAFQQSLVTGGAGAEPPPGVDSASLLTSGSTNPEQMMETQRNQAIQDQPERTAY